MDALEFEKIIEGLNKDKYHVCRELGFNDGKFVLSKWSIFRKDMSNEEYFDESNLAILSSTNGNTFEDVKELIKKENK